MIKTQMEEFQTFAYLLRYIGKIKIWGIMNS